MLRRLLTTLGVAAGFFACLFAFSPDPYAGVPTESERKGFQWFVMFDSCGGEGPSGAACLDSCDFTPVTAQGETLKVDGYAVAAYDSSWESPASVGVLSVKPRPCGISGRQKWETLLDVWPPHGGMEAKGIPVMGPVYGTGSGTAQETPSFIDTGYIPLRDVCQLTFFSTNAKWYIYVTWYFGNSHNDHLDWSE